MINRKGFSLLEVMVAMVLIAGVGMGLYAWINTNLLSLHRVQDHTLRRETALNALAFMESINPMERPKGEAIVGPYTVRWDAHLLEPDQNAIGGNPFRVGLYETEVRVEWDAREVVNFNLRQVGYQKVQALENARLQ